MHKLLISYAILVCSCGHPATGHTQIIQQVTDDRGLTSVVYTQGLDTFSLDYLTPDELNILCNK